MILELDNNLKIGNMIHEDERRILEDWPEAKFITAKKDCVLGDHYHKIKTEKFILVKGKSILKFGLSELDSKFLQAYDKDGYEETVFYFYKNGYGSMASVILSSAIRNREAIDKGILMKIGEIYTVEPNIRHTFELTAGSVLIGLCSHEYDPEDDYK